MKFYQKLSKDALIESSEFKKYKFKYIIYILNNSISFGQLRSLYGINHMDCINADSARGINMNNYIHLTIRPIYDYKEHLLSEQIKFFKFQKNKIKKSESQDEIPSGIIYY